MKIENDVDCSIYVDASIKVDDLARAMADASTGSMVTPSSDDSRATVRGDWFEIEVLKNGDADSIRRVEFPDGFLYFSLKIDIYVDPACATMEERVRLVDRLLRLFWENGRAAVAACDYESQLRHGGGFNCADIPWTRR